MKISIVVPTRNRPELLVNVVRSVLDQDYLDFELIIADNSSNTISRDAIAHLNDSRIRYIPSTEDLDVTENWNRALRYATGDFILMLGDDDALVPNGLTFLVQELLCHPDTDCAYVGCFLLSFPNVFPGEPKGFLRTYRNRSIYHARRNSFILNNKLKEDLVEQSMNFKVSFDYNPQFWVISRFFLETHFSQAKLYKSPYPDYYAAIALMHLSKKVLVIPEEIVIIGITKQSHGFLHFSGDDHSADAFLTLGRKDPLMTKIVSRLIPVHFMTNMWAVSLEYLYSDFRLKVNWRRYRNIQLDFLKIALIQTQELDYKVLRSLKLREFVQIIRFFISVRNLPEKSANNAIFEIRSKIDTHPRFEMHNLDLESPTYKPIFDRFKELISTLP